jgi:hypothetical protein
MENKMTETERTKRIGNYEVKFKTIISEDTGDAIHLKISYTQDTLEMIKQICCLTEPLTEIKVKVGADLDGSSIYDTFQRYKVKRVVYGSLSGEQRDIVFLKELVDNGEITLKLLDVRKVEDIVMGFKSVISEIIRIMTRYADLDANVSFKVNFSE